MLIYRLTRQKYAKDLSGFGAKRFGGRWNYKGVTVVYTSEHISLALSELLVHANTQFLANDYHLLTIHIPNAIAIEKFVISDLPYSWRSVDTNALQSIGSDWVQTARSAVLAVPSAIVPQEKNYLINPQHKDFSQFRVENVPFEIDPRFNRKSRPMGKD